MQAEIVGVSFAVEAGEAAYVPLAHIILGLKDSSIVNRCLSSCDHSLESDAVKKVGHHLKHDANVLANRHYAARYSARHHARVLYWTQLGAVMIWAAWRLNISVSEVISRGGCR